MQPRLVILLLALALGACAAPAPQTETAAKADNCAAFDAANPDRKPADPSVKRSCWGTPPKSHPRSLLAATYPNAAALKADVAKEISGMAVTLDGDMIRSGMGPSINYRTLSDGSVSR